MIRRPILLLPIVFLLCIVTVSVPVFYRLLRVPAAAAVSAQAIAGDVSLCFSNASGKTPVDTKAMQACGEQIDEYAKARFDEMRWMLTMIGSLAAIFALGQTASMYFAANNYRQAADEALARMKNQQESVRARYPLFEKIEEDREAAYAALDRSLLFASPVEDPTASPTEAVGYVQTMYQDMPVEERQRLLSLESFVSLDLHPGTKGGERYAEQLVKLAVFYRSKFLYEHSLGRGSLVDLERSEAYLRLARKQSRTDFTILNELGMLYIVLHKHVAGGSSPFAYLDEAQKHFEESARIDPEQQRAYYNLGTVEGKYRSNFGLAVKHLEKAKTKKRWQREPAPKYMESFLYYNLGCYAAQELVGTQLPISKESASDCLKYLKCAASRSDIPREFIEKDFATGDLGVLYRDLADDSLKQELTALRTAFLGEKREVEPKIKTRPGGIRRWLRREG